MSAPVQNQEEARPDPAAYRFEWRDSVLGAQFLFVAFGALVLVPILTGLDPNVALFTAGACRVAHPHPGEPWRGGGKAPGHPFSWRYYESANS